MEVRSGPVSGKMARFPGKRARFREGENKSGQRFSQVISYSNPEKPENPAFFRVYVEKPENGLVGR
jgi:hypothetical protein